MRSSLLFLVGLATAAAGMATTGGGALAQTTANCDPTLPMAATGTLTVLDDCVVGGDLTVSGGAALTFDYSGQRGSQLVVLGNVVVRDQASLVVLGRADRKAVFAIDNRANQQRTMISSNTAAIRLEQVEFRTQRTPDPSLGSISMMYTARDQSSLVVKSSTIVARQSWLLADMRDASTLTVADTLQVPTEAYLRNASQTRLSGKTTHLGLWLDGSGAKGTLQLPLTTAPFTWTAGAPAGLGVKWSLQVTDAFPGLGVEVQPTSALTIVGNGTRAPQTGEVRLGYYVVNAIETLTNLKTGLQNAKISSRLTLQNVQLGPIGWQFYVGDKSDLTIRSSTINEIGIYGYGAKVHVDRSLLQFAVIGAVGIGSAIDISNSEIWNQAIQATNQSKVTLTGNTVYGSLFYPQDAASAVAISGGSFRQNPSVCSVDTMVNVTTGQPQCNPYSSAGMPKRMGAGKTTCATTSGCSW